MLYAAIPFATIYKLLPLPFEYVILLLILEANGIIVKTRMGEIRGKYAETETQRTPHHAFLGIPYAEPPVKSRRFKPPQPKTNLTKVWNATKQRSGCITIEVEYLLSWEGDEDCLYLNIFTTALPDKKKNLPVLVWIHGGFFFRGGTSSSNYNLDYFIDQHIVSVSIAYRLGFLGFYHDDEEVQGNMGIKDQLLALKWIHENIEYFGGDPKKVTIMGESAGAACVSYLVQTPLSRGLFQRAIMMSGNSLTGWAKAREGGRLTNKLLTFHKMMMQVIDTITGGVPRVFFTFLPTLKMYLDIAYDPFEGLLFAPVQEKPSNTSVFTKSAYDVLKWCENDSFVPILIGHTANEAQALFDHNFVTKILANVLNVVYNMFSSSLLPRDIQVLKDCSFLGDEAKKYYKLSTRQEMIIFITDVFFILPTVQYVKMYSKCSDVYSLRFSYKDAAHGDDLLYLFSNKANYLKNATDKEVSERMVRIWSNFIKFGTPVGKKNSSNIFWPKSQSQNKYIYMNINETLYLHTLSDSPHAKNLKFWEQIYTKCGMKRSLIPF